MEKDWWRCQNCGYIYKPDIGDAVSKIAPRTPFSNLPSNWVCPVCFTEKSDFLPFENV